MSNAQDQHTERQDGGTLQKLATSVAVIESQMGSLREFLELRFDNIDRANDKKDNKIEGIDKRTYQNAKDISRVTTWMTIIGTVIGIAVALSYLLP